MAPTSNFLSSDLKFVAKLRGGTTNDTAVVQAYLGGAPLQRLSYDFQNNLRSVVSILDPLDAWSPRSDRLLGLWFAEKSWWADHGHRFLEWARDQIGAAPKADRYGALRKVLATQRLSEKKVLEATAQHLTSALFTDGQPTSLGRWLDTHVEAFDALWKSADERGQAALAGFLLRQKPKAFEARLERLAFKDADAQVELALAMLSVNAAKYGPRALEWLEGLRAPDALIEAAEPLFASRPEVARQLAVKALDVCDPERHYEYGIDASRLLLKHFGEKAIDDLRHFHTVNPAGRLKWMTVVHRALGARAVPVLVDCLLMPFDEAQIWGFVNYPKYVAAVGRLVPGIALQPHRVRIEAHFAKVKSKKVREVVTQILGGKSKEKPLVKPTVTYALDTYAAALLRGVEKAILAERKEVTEPVQSVHLHREDGSFWVSAIVISLGKDLLEIELPAIATRLPGPLDGESWDPILAKHLRRHGYDPDKDGEDLPSWDDQFGLCAALVNHELIGVAQDVLPRLARAGIAVEKGCRGSTGEHDSEWSDRDDMLGCVRDELAFFTSKTMLAEFACLFFEDPKRQKWLMGLAAT